VANSRQRGQNTFVFKTCSLKLRDKWAKTLRPQVEAGRCVELEREMAQPSRFFTSHNVTFATSFKKLALLSRFFDFGSVCNLILELQHQCLAGTSRLLFGFGQRSEIHAQAVQIIGAALTRANCCGVKQPGSWFDPSFVIEWQCTCEGLRSPAVSLKPQTGAHRRPSVNRWLFAFTPPQGCRREGLAYRGGLGAKMGSNSKKYVRHREAA
jgi:hypothetical protein